MNGLIESLEKKKLIKKRQSEEDRRTKLIQISEQGEELEKKLWVVIEDIEQDLLDGFNQEEQQMMISWLKRMRENVQSCK